MHTTARAWEAPAPVAEQMPWEASDAEQSPPASEAPASPPADAYPPVPQWATQRAPSPPPPRSPDAAASLQRRDSLSELAAESVRPAPQKKQKGGVRARDRG
jgi:hypothetical protein